MIVHSLTISGLDIADGRFYEYDLTFSQHSFSVNIHFQKEQYQSKEAFAMKTAIEVEQMQLKAEKLRQEVSPVQNRDSRLND